MHRRGLTHRGHPSRERSTLVTTERLALSEERSPGHASWQCPRGEAGRPHGLENPSHSASTSVELRRFRRTEGSSVTGRLRTGFLTQTALGLSLGSEERPLLSTCPPVKCEQSLFHRAAGSLREILYTPCLDYCLH